MSKLFSGMTNEGHEEVQDRLGGFSARETDIYTGIIKVAYHGKWDSGAQYIHVIFNDGQEYSETITFTNKKGENWYPVKDNNGKETGKKGSLPGFIIINDLCMIAGGAPLSEMEVEEKVVNVWDKDAKKELPKSVPVLTALTGKPISLAITKTTENKTKKEADGSITTLDETRDVNSITKVFDTDTKLTVVEAEKGLTKGEFWDKWLEKNKGVTVNKVKSTDGKSGRPGGPPQAGAAQEPRKSLFNKG